MGKVKVQRQKVSWESEAMVRIRYLVGLGFNLEIFHLSRWEALENQPGSR